MTQQYMDVFYNDDGLGATTAVPKQAVVKAPKPPTPQQQQQMNIEAASARLGSTQKYVIMGAVVLLAGAVAYSMLTKE